MQAEQLKFQQDMLNKTAENEYSSWLREKRLHALLNLQKSFDDLSFLNSKWGFKESRETESWEKSVEKVEADLSAALSEVTLVFGNHHEVVEHVTQLAKCSRKMTSLVRLPFQEGQKLSNWDTILKDRKSWMQGSSDAYIELWIRTNSITFPQLWEGSQSPSPEKK